MKIRLTTAVLLSTAILIGGVLPTSRAWAKEPVREFLDEHRLSEIHRESRHDANVECAKLHDRMP